MQKQKININDILNKAEKANELQRKVEYPAKETPLPAGKSASDESEAFNAVNTGNQATGGASAPKRETDEIIDKYSQKSRITLDEKASTDALREMLNTQMSNDKELFNYYRSFENRKKSRKVEELYKLINFATQSDLEERESLTGAGGQKENTSAPHFTEPTGNENKREKKYKQLKLYDFGETQNIPEATGGTPEQGNHSAEFDEDYDALSDKIESGEINFTEETNDHQISIINEEPAIEKPKPSMDTKDINLRLVFDMLDEDTPIPDELKNENEKNKDKNKKHKKKDKAKPAEPAYEYVSRNQNSEIQELLTRAIRSSLAKLIVSLLLCLGILYMELADETSGLYSVYTLPGKYGVLYTLVNLQLLFFLVITLLDSVRKGAAGLFSGKPNAESVLFVSFIAASAHCILTIFLDNEVSHGLYCLPCAALGVTCAFIKYLQCRKDYHCFKVVASTRNKYVAEKLTGNTKEAEEFYKYLFDESEIYTTRKTEFVEGFFRRLHTRPESESINGFIISFVFIVAGVLFGLTMYRGSTIYEAFTMFTQTLAFSLPFSSFLIIALPVIAANRIGRKNGSAFIGNAVGEEYADASVISFSDTEVYPANLVKITSIKVYGENRIDKIIGDLARVFSFAGGPLKTVTAGMIAGDIPAPVNPKLIESASDGICVVIDGREMFLGKRNYLRRYRFEAPYDDSDAAFEKKNGSIMYVTLNDSLTAKVYVKYTLNPQFNSLLKDLYKAGMCVGIKTTDPNITTSLIEQSVKYKKTPISILKAGDIADIESENEKTDSGIVVNASLHTFLKMFIVCDKIRHVTKANGIINLLSLTIAVFVVYFLAFTGQLLGLPSWYPVLFQFIWLVPVSLVSFLL
ncbi:MAG: hypothetical protein PHW77_03730 [Eubacteriales bacterium]|nr:hypothetical protein [Eubacteriales bacterium]